MIDETVVVGVLPTTIIKRDGRTVAFDLGKVHGALAKCYAALGREPVVPLDELTRRVGNMAAMRHARGEALTVEGVQDTVEMVLQAAGEWDAAKHYILYRAERQRERAERPIPDEVRAAFAASDPYFPTPLQRFQFFDKYSRFNETLGRRETWIETVDRAVAFLDELAKGALPPDVKERIRQGILEMRVMPSMRLLAMAGPAARRNNASIYNCSYQPVDSIYAFSEALSISMAGCGVGYSVESQYVDALPPVKKQRSYNDDSIFTIEDSAEGWADALAFGIEQWIAGVDVRFDYSQIRPAGAVLKTKGGRASGPGPLKEMLESVRARILSRQGRRLRPIDAHDMMCMVGQAAVSGGVRRTAMIALFDPDDQEMLHCKSGDFERENSQRWNANNSAVWSEDGTDAVEFLKQFTAMLESGRGEPGIFNRQAVLATIPERRSRDETYGTNPCAEIILKNRQFCNLSAAVVRAGDTPGDLYEKVELATIIGTIQSMATHFPGLRPEWQANCEEERLLGVDITGQQDNPALLTPEVLEQARAIAVQTNAAWAERFGINQSAAITCVKPSGNTSQLVNCASGLHPRWSPYYIRNVRVSATSALAKVLRDAGAPMNPENGDDPENPRTWVVSFPVKSPDGSVTRADMDAIQQCEWWLRNKVHWTEHNPSVTITYKPDEAVKLAAWVWENRERVGGMAFLPSFDAKYAQLPYIEIDREEYERRLAAFPEVDFSKIYRYETDDRTSAAQELACSAGVCEIDA